MDMHLVEANMKARKFGVGALLAVVAAVALAGTAAAQCNPPVLIKFDNDTFAWETAYNPATFISSAGSQLTVVGKIVCFGGPLAFLNGNMPGKEYTLIWNLTS